MELERNKAVFRPFARFNEVLSHLGEGAASLLASIGSDLTLVLADDGSIFDLAFRSPDLVAWNCDHWVGKNWREVVTVESVAKIEALFADVGKQVITRRRQLNHPSRTASDLPVDYMIVTFPGAPYRIALGNDLRQIAAMQSQLVQFQMELEGEYRKVRENEARYRTLFHLSGDAMVVVGEADMKILDANQAAAAFTGKPPRKMVGENIAGIFEKAAREAATAKLQEARISGRAQLFETRLSHQGLPALATVESYREAGRSNLVIRLSQPGQSGEAQIPRGSGIDMVPEPAVVTDANGEVLAANEAFLDLVNSPNMSLVLGKRLQNWVGGSSVDLQVLMTRLREEGSIRGFATLVRDEVGVDTSVIVSATKSRANDGPERYSFLILEGARRQSALAGPTGQHLRDKGDFSELVGRVPLKELIREAADVIEVMCIEAALRQSDNNRASAAELLGLSRQSLYLKLKRYGLADYGSES